MIPRVVLVLLLALAAVTAYCARQGGDAPPAQGEPAPREEEPVGVRLGDTDLGSLEGVEVIEQELPFGDPGLICGRELDLFCLSDYLATSPPRWLHAVPPPSNPGSCWLDPNVPAWTPEEARVPPLLAMRCRPERGHIFSTGGSADAGERAVAWGLQWLARQQKADGGWEFDGADAGDRVAATGLALLAFLGRGHTHTLTLAVVLDDPKQPPVYGPKGLIPPRWHFEVRENGPYRFVVQRGIEFLLARCPVTGATAGMMSRNIRSQAIATLALCEAATMTPDDRELLAAAQASINHLVRCQGTDGGWGLAPGARGDMAVVGWVAQALHAARSSTVITVPRATVAGVGRFLDHVSDGPVRAAYGTVDARDAAPGTTATATGLLARLLLSDWTPEHPGLRAGVAGIMESPINAALLADVEYCYFATLTLRLYEGSECKDWAEGPKYPDGLRRGGVREGFTGRQVRQQGPQRGRFEVPAGWLGKRWGALGSTALCVLALESPYRQTPLGKGLNPH